MPQGEVFLSHSSLDQPFVTSVADTLGRHGVPVWYSRTSIVAARQWHDEIGDALKRCDWFMLVLSPDSVESLWVKRETLFALNNKRYADRIIPLLYRACDYDQLSWTLSSMQMVDFTRDFDGGCRDLLRVWGLGYRK